MKTISAIRVLVEKSEVSIVPRSKLGEPVHDPRRREGGRDGQAL
jgi:hypothetical protein